MAIPVIVIAGPTASGKSDLAIQLAKKYNGNIISADSLQVYQGLDIGTAKTPVPEREGIPHYLLDVVDETADFSVADFISLADQAILETVKSGRVPIVVGGTGFYVKALLGFQSLDFAQSNDEEVQEDQKKPLEELQVKLKQLADEKLLNRVDLQNKDRVIRAIQIARHGQVDRPKRPEYTGLILALDWPREVLYDRINGRVQLMVDQGLKEEAKALYDRGGLALQAGRGIGYAEFYPFFEGQQTLSEVLAAIQQNSRRYAKRQLTYWRHQIPGLQWIDGQDAWKIADQKVADFLKEYQQ
ncbi:tRNA (adenosine(37)-N6)-dimethylallyltransferase MiaA [Fructobacillus evanidus]|uniref:tRNA dimethylallyltransferase n=1 Tax=Fructobacillus evanidus TaxID=3064281 RepID=A0ABM9MP26_9LACO|nr:tRNA A37 N6-isopentenylltransferase MiaA (MiaA) [Fructobacillus sp. LMG 32999]CAK1221523.1 tRNA A37 N6-isopentenylltransferase MiaA (MiaA) [Fructobacillus sp. LMG 32999]CAK1224619.1 tRNA A37 N6-isopentenylltransferase MiaA (MiaA) [Fructobacillus sp. LMG 32999]CAK1229593.1 tRNA A37 N6-isopentenylltransferase MiaA (MiaA) [Fructobacillus sp. LMG 32999]CAK1229779.1 tRNA A37 N6-isopentenylltransferase MiaA (MiaA) [Fructobacillus sp. LMG 32999]